MPSAPDDATAKARILKEVSDAIQVLLLEEAFYGHFFLGLLHEVHSRVPTMAIGPEGSRVKLHINPKFWQEELTRPELRRGLIKHEILHVVFKHILRAKDFQRKDIFNVACDLVVNQYILSSELPENRIHLDTFPDLDLAPEMDADYYYRALTDLYDRMDEDGDNRQDSPGWNNLRRILDENDDWQQKHGLWEDIENLPTSLREIIEQNIEEVLKSATSRAKRSTSWGKMRGSLRTYLEGFEAAPEPQVNWRRLLRIFTESSSRTYIKNTVKRPSRRYGTTPGIRIRKRKKLLVVVDTSGSITEPDLREFFSEIFHIHKRGAEVTVVECDVAIAATYRYRGQVPEHVTGRGGTNFNAPIEFANRKFHPDAIIYFTDGYAPAPEIASRSPLLWIISSNGAEPGSRQYEALPGMKIRMEQK